MGSFTTEISTRVRKFLAKDKSTQALQISKGATAPMPSSGYDLLNVYGQDALAEYLRLDHDMITRFVDYEEMDDYPEIATALDIFADDATQTESQINRSMWIEAKDRSVQENLDDLFRIRLRADEEGWEIARTVCKYGNDYEELLVGPEGVMGLNYLPPSSMRRIEGPRGELYGFIQDFKGKFGYTPQDWKQLLAQRRGPAMSAENMIPTALEDWEVVHFRLRGKYRRSVYGHSVLEPARWIWKRLALLEDAAMIYRLQRAPERFAFYVDVGDMPPPEALAYLNRVRQQMKKSKFINPTTGKLDMRHNPMSADDDFFFASRNGSDGTRVETVGSPAWQSMEDIQYFQDKMFAAIKIPKAYLGKDEGSVKSVLSQSDVRFARTVLRVQKELKAGYWKMARVHLAAQGLDPFKSEYDIKMTVPSAIFELAQLEVRNARADLANRMREFVSLHWILRNVFAVAEEDIEVILGERQEDSIREALTSAKGEAAAQALVNPQGQGQEPGAPPPPTGQDSVAESKQRIFMRSMQRPITERELFAGDREGEKRAEMKLNQLLKNDVRLAAKLADVSTMLHDIRAIRAKPLR